MKKINKKLTLKKKTISQLSNEQLHQIQGKGTIWPCRITTGCTLSPMC